MTYLELQTELQNRLSINASNTFWGTAMIGEWLNQANRWACSYKHWPFTEKALKTQSVANALYYDYPPEFRTDSIRLLEIDGEKYQKVRYEDFMDYIRNNPNGSDKIFSDFRRQYFINPKIPVNGKEIVVWGQEKPAKLVNNNDTTPFSDGEEAGEEAIIKKALSIALAKAGKYREAAVERDEAKLILEEIWARILEEQGGYHSKNNQIFSVPNFLD